jgi:hypothetical protein
MSFISRLQCPRFDDQIGQNFAHLNCKVLIAVQVSSARLRPSCFAPHRASTCSRSTNGKALRAFRQPAEGGRDRRDTLRSPALRRSTDQASSRPSIPRSRQIVEVDVERGGDLFQRLDRCFTLAVLDLRQVDKTDPGALSELAQRVTTILRARRGLGSLGRSGMPFALFAWRLGSDPQLLALPGRR